MKVDHYAYRVTWSAATPNLSLLAIPPNHRLEAHKGNRKGRWSIRINDQWRVCFRFSDGRAQNVEIVDYH